MDPKLTATELRFNNVIFKCQFEDKWYNRKTMQSFALAQIDAVIPQPNGTMSVNISSVIICEDCFERNKETDLKLEEPSPIIVPEVKLPKNLKN